MMFRFFYRWLLRFHPARFRERFAEEMLSIFDHVETRAAAANLVAEAFISLVRQWTMRSEYWKEQAAATVSPAADGSPVFFTLETFKPRKSALFEGAVLTWIVCSVLFFVLKNSRMHYAYLPEVIFESATEPDAKLLNRTSNESLIYYVGVYSTDAPNKLTALITVEDGKLAIEIRGEQKSILVPVNKTKFAFSERQNDSIEFLRYDNGAINAVRIFRNGSEFTARRTTN
jgi:hypothetical protein